MGAPTTTRPDTRRGALPPSDQLAATPASPSPTNRLAPPLVTDDVLTIALAALVLAALLPFGRIYIGPEWVRPVVGAAVLSLGIGWGARKLGAGPIAHLLMTMAGLLVFLTIAFLPTTAAAGLLPTLDTVESLRALFVRGLELVEVRPSPTFAEAGLLLLTVCGVWVVAYLADGMLFVLRSATKAITTAVVLWSVPLAVAPADTSNVRDTAVLLLTAGVLLMLGNTMSTGAWGVRILATERRQRIIPPVGWAMLAIATAAALLLASLVPGYEAAPIYTVRGSSGTTITTNPIVNIRQRLVATNTGPVVRVDAPRPLYLRTTALDTFNEFEEWGLSGTIAGDRVGGRVDQAPAIPTETVQATVLIEGIESGAILAPTPYQTIEVAGSVAQDMRYDQASATLTVSSDRPLQRGDSYRVTAAIPQPAVDTLRATPKPGPDRHTALPDNISPTVVTLAADIVAAAGASTMFDQALAIQDHLRRWTYSTDPQFGPGATAMEQFVNGQQGYCEQFAGTMAVMLRSLGIPARLAVGYTPGTQQADGLWEVTNANAHAWVEVDFGGLGWVTFEPTPRTDGNVLVPTGTAITPAETVAMGSGSTAEPAGPGELPQARPSEDPRLREEAVTPVDGQVGADGTGGSGRAGGGLPGWLLLALLGTVGIGLATAGRRRQASHAKPPPEVRIANARARAERAGAVVGQSRRPEETDHEYFGRLSGGATTGTALATPSTRAAYAPAVDEHDARVAEAAATDLRYRLIGDAGRLSRLRLGLSDLLARWR